MINFLVCDVDQIRFATIEDVDAHLTVNPSHYGHIGWAGDLAAIPPIGGSSTVPQYTSDPSFPSAGEQWVLASGSAGVSGQAMGVLGLPYSRTEVREYQLSIKMDNGDIKRTELT